MYKKASMAAECFCWLDDLTIKSEVCLSEERLFYFHYPISIHLLITFILSRSELEHTLAELVLLILPSIKYKNDC